MHERTDTDFMKSRKGQAARRIRKAGERPGRNATSSPKSDGVTGEQLALDLHTAADLDAILVELFN